MNRDLMFLIISAIFIVGFMGGFIGNLGLEDYLDERSKKKEFDLTPDQQEKIEELAQRIDEEIQKLTNKGDDD